MIWFHLFLFCFSIFWQFGFMNIVLTCCTLRFTTRKDIRTFYFGTCLLVDFKWGFLLAFILINYSRLFNYSRIFHCTRISSYELLYFLNPNNTKKLTNYLQLENLFNHFYVRSKKNYLRWIGQGRKLMLNIDFNHECLFFN